MSENRVIAGRTFRSIVASPTTMQNEVWVQSLIGRAGLDRMKLLPGETAVAFAARMLRQLYGDTDIFLLLGGLMIPAEMDSLAWTPETAGETAAFLAKCSRPEDKLLIRGEIAGLLEGFLRAGLLELMTTQRSGSSEPQDSKPVSRAVVGSYSESSQKSSEPSATSISSEPAFSSGHGR